MPIINFCCRLPDFKMDPAVLFPWRGGPRIRGLLWREAGCTPLESFLPDRSGSCQPLSASLTGEWDRHASAYLCLPLPVQTGATPFRTVTFWGHWWVPEERQDSLATVTLEQTGTGTSDIPKDRRCQAAGCAGSELLARRCLPRLACPGVCRQLHVVGVLHPILWGSALLLTLGYTLLILRCH